MTREIEIDRKEFLGLPAEEIRRIVIEKNTPRVGIFVADGSRRLLMCRTGLSPTSEEFYSEYARFFVEAFKYSLEIFFDHGLRSLFFPLFGPSVMRRKNKFQSITIPGIYKEIFQSDEGFNFYKEKGIKIKAYGDLSQLEKIDINKLNMAEGVRQMIEKTASHKKHTLFFGFMSRNTVGIEMPEQIIDFYKSHNRIPSHQEMIETYYGESVPEADFLIFSHKFSSPGVLPPLIVTPKTRMFYFPVPGFLAFNAIAYRKIIYDLNFIQLSQSHTAYTEEDLNYIESLERYYKQHKNKIIGTRKKIGKFLVPDI
jgi:hypothetical protein